MKQSFTSRETSRGQALAILGLLLFCVPLIVSGLRQATFDGRPAAFRDAAGNVANDNEILLTWQGSTVDDPRAADLRQELLGQVAVDGLLRGGCPYVADVLLADTMLTSLVAAEMPVEKATDSLSGIWLGRGGLKIRATASGQRDLEWTAKRIATELEQTPGRDVKVIVRGVTTPVVGKSKSSLEIDDYDLEVFCTQAGDSLAVPATLQDEVLKVCGYPTSDEPEGQKLVEAAFKAVGTPTAARVMLSDAGCAEPMAAAAAVRRAAIAAGIPEEDLLMSGPRVESAERASELRATVWPTTSGQFFHGPWSPMLASLVGGAIVSVLLGGLTVDLLAAVVLGGFGATALAAAVNAVGVAWTESLLLMPAVVFVLTVASALLEPATTGTLIARVRKPMSGSTMLCALCVVTLLAGSNMGRASDRQFALLGAAACGLAWVLSTVCIPALAGLFRSGPFRRTTVGQDFAEWVVTHQRLAMSTAALIGISTGVALLQPTVQDWVGQPAEWRGMTAQHQLERCLAGTSEVTAEIQFDSANTQRLRFLERADIVRGVTANLKKCGGVTGAMSLADAAPVIERPADGARTRERSAYIVKSNKASQTLREQNAAMGGMWLASDGMESDDVLQSETWTIKASVAQMTMSSPAAVMQDLNQAVQEVLRFHAGVSHRISGPLPLAAAHASTPSRRPALVGVLAVLALGVASLGTGSLVSGLVIAIVVAAPALVVLVSPALAGAQAGMPAALAVSLAVFLGVLSCVRLVNDLTEWSAATSTRSEALAFALSGAASRARQALVLVGIVMLCAGVLCPEICPAATRSGAWATAWSGVSSLAIFPLLLSGRLGRMIGRQAVVSEASDEAVIVGPIRLEPASEVPNLEIDTVRHRVRNAG